MDDLIVKIIVKITVTCISGRLQAVREEIPATELPKGWTLNEAYLVYPEGRAHYATCCATPDKADLMSAKTKDMYNKWETTWP